MTAPPIMTLRRSHAMRLVPAAVHMTCGDILALSGAAIAALWLLVALGHPIGLVETAGSSLKDAAATLPSFKTYVTVVLAIGFYLSSAMTTYCGLYWRKRVRMNRRGQVMFLADMKQVVSDALSVAAFISAILAFMIWLGAKLILA